MSFFGPQLAFIIMTNPARVTRSSITRTQHRNQHVNRRFVQRVSYDNAAQKYLCASFQRSEVKDDFPLIRVMDVLIADLVGHHSALDLGSFLLDQVEPNSHQRVHVRGLRKRFQDWLKFSLENLHEDHTNLVLFKTFCGKKCWVLIVG